MSESLNTCAVEAELIRSSEYCSRNAALPPEIGKLANLKRLNLAYNPVTALPPEIGRR